MKDECGAWRWDLKTLTDSRLKRVKMKDTVQTTVMSQTLRIPPKKLNRFHDIATQRFDSEDTLYSIIAELVGYKEEYKPSTDTGDHDFHIVLCDLKCDSTMVVEIPSTEYCSSAKSSAFHHTFDEARSAFLAILQANNLPEPKQDRMTTVARKTSKHIILRIVGVGFWDLPSGHASGSAHNGFELHPVLQIEEKN